MRRTGVKEEVGSAYQAVSGQSGVFCRDKHWAELWIYGGISRSLKTGRTEGVCQFMFFFNAYVVISS